MGEPRMTLATQRVLGAFLADSDREFHGYELGQEAGLASGTIHPILARLEAAGWLDSRWEEIDERAEGRRARRYYRLTDSGVNAARAALARVRPVGRLALRPSEGS
ncbi:MAG: PadR family transcriptional regulator [Nostocoides sp.]